jgi:hypothetical protein
MACRIVSATVNLTRSETPEDSRIHTIYIYIYIYIYILEEHTQIVYCFEIILDPYVSLGTLKEQAI